MPSAVESENTDIAECARPEQNRLRSAIRSGLALVGTFASSLAIGQDTWTVNPGHRLSAGYSFVKNTQAELGGALGLHVTDFTMSLAGANVAKRTGDALAPLPTVGLYGSYALTPRWLLSGRADFFSFSHHDYDGSLVNLVAGVDYRFTRNFGIGLGYRYVDYDLDVTKSSFSGNVQYEFSGPVLYLAGSF